MGNQVVPLTETLGQMPDRRLQEIHHLLWALARRD